MKPNKGIFASIFVMAAASAMAATAPEVLDVNMTQLANKFVSITYKLTNGPAVVTLDIQTNSAPGVWASIGAQNIDVLDGDVNRLVSGGDASTTHSITWRPWKSWPGHMIGAGKARAVVTAWATNAPPDYMVVSLAAEANPRTRYYASVDALPGGLLANTAYRTSLLVLRRIHAAGITWMMGQNTENTYEEEKSHDVMLANDYYIGVFPITQKQWSNVAGTGLPAYYNGGGHGDMRPMEWVAFRDVRESPISGTGQWCGGAANENYMYPNPPNPDSYLGQLRTRTHVDFDLPSEAQWEYACRGGYGDGHWGDGSLYTNSSTDANLSRIACYGRTKSDDRGIDPAEGGTPIVGSYEPNAFGLYDMHGCVFEHCLDWVDTDITALNGVPNANGKYLLTKPDTAGGNRMRRGGNYRYGALYSRPSYRGNTNPNGYRLDDTGFRVICPAVAK